MKTPDSNGPAYRIETARLTLRCWSPQDALAAQLTMARSDAHLRRFIPFSCDRARTVDEMVQWLRGHRAAFDRDEHYRYGVFDPAGGAVLGEAMLLDREQDGTREVGYWIDVECGRRGYATEATAALIAVAFELDRVDEVTLNCSPTNAGSVAIARRLGFEHVDTITRDDPVGPDDLESMRWRLSEAAYRSSSASAAELRAFDALDRPLLMRGPAEPGS